MLLKSLLSNAPKVKEDPEATPRPEYEPSYGRRAKSGETVSVTSAQSIATAYRCKNIISDSVAIMPLKQYIRRGATGQAVDEDPVTRNMPYLTQISPNLWGMSPFQFKKAFVEWLLFYGNAYIWKPPVSPAQLFILPANKTQPVFDLDGNLWYAHRFSNSLTPAYIPAVEVLQLLINPDESGFMGRGVITFARETFGRRLAANKTQSMLFSQGFMPAAYIKMAGTVESDGRKKIRGAYEEAMSGADNAYRLAIFDNKVTEYKPVEMQLKDSDWLASIDGTDRDICNWFGMPEHMLNRGKEAYNSNEEKYDEYISITLDPFLVPWEEAARIRWTPEREQASTYFKFKREALYRMKAKERAEMNEIKIRSGQMTPNEAIIIEDGQPFPEGNQHYMASNIASIDGAPTPLP